MLRRYYLFITILFIKQINAYALVSQGHGFTQPKPILQTFCLVHSAKGFGLRFLSLPSFLRAQPTRGTRYLGVLNHTDLPFRLSSTQIRSRGRRKFNEDAIGLARLLTLSQIG